MPMCDCLIVGGGVVGLSLAYELSGHGWAITVVERGEPGREASWAGAGILPPANRATAQYPFDELRGLSFERHEAWAESLRRETGLDTGFRRCGAVYLGRTIGETAALRGLAELLREEQVRIEPLGDAELAEIEPALAGALRERRARAAYFLPDEAQIRNPRHLAALVAACQQRGVRIRSHTEVVGWRTQGQRIVAAETPGEVLHATRFCITAGAWSQRLLKQLETPTGILPIRGQMLLWHAERTICRRVINDGPRYIVPRDDGHVLVGSTEEEVGFDCRTTDEAIADLTRLALELVPGLREARLLRAWAGLRPASFDGLPYIGRLPGFENGFAAAGHFRSGLYLSPGTAVVLGQLMRDQQPEIDLTPFQLARG